MKQQESSEILLAGAERSQLKLVQSHSKAPQEYPLFFQSHTASHCHSVTAKLVIDLPHQSKGKVNHIVTVDLHLKNTLITYYGEKGELEFNLF